MTWQPRVAWSPSWSRRITLVLGVNAALIHGRCLKHPGLRRLHVTTAPSLQHPTHPRSSPQALIIGSTLNIEARTFCQPLHKISRNHTHYKLVSARTRLFSTLQAQIVTNINAIPTMMRTQLCWIIWAAGVIKDVQCHTPRMNFTRAIAPKDASEILRRSSRDPGDDLPTLERLSISSRLEA